MLTGRRFTDSCNSKAWAVECYRDELRVPLATSILNLSSLLLLVVLTCLVVGPLLIGLCLARRSLEDLTMAGIRVHIYADMVSALLNPNND